MTKCRQCNVTISDNTTVCPLCHCVVDAEADPIRRIGEYPAIWLKQRKLKHVSNILLVAVLTASAILLLCNYIFFQKYWWCVIPIAAIAYAYLVFQLVVVSQKGYRTKVLIPLILAILLIILIDLETGFYRWSLNFVLPGGILLVDLIIVILMLTNMKNWQSYIIMQLGMVVASLVPLALLITGPITMPILCIITFGVSLLLFLGTVIIGDRTARSELKRRFHIR